jgi:hypothetical protein
MPAQPGQTKSRAGVSGVAIVAGLLIGIGVGMLMGNTAAGVMLGLGGGFLGMIVLRVKLGEW